MKQRPLTAKRLENATAGSNDQWLLDNNGLYARVHKGSADHRPRITFVYRYKTGGKTRWHRLGEYSTAYRLADARRDHAKARNQRDQGLDPSRERERLKADNAAKEQAQALEKTMRGLFEDWEKKHLKGQRKDGGAMVRQFIESDVLQYIGKIKARDVTRQDLVQLIDRIADRGSNRKANAVLSLLKQMYKHGLARGIVDADPTYGLTKAHAGGKETPRERNLAPAEITALAKVLPDANLPDRLQAALWLLLATGARVGELIRAEWREFDLDARTWTIPAERSKNKKQHIVYLSDFAVRWLKVLQDKGTTTLLFEGRKEREPLSEKWISKCLRDRQRTKAFKKRTTKTGVLLLDGGEWRAHDLRRTMASRMGDLGIAPHVIEKCLNHTLGGILAVYQRQDYLAERREAFDTWGRYLERITTADASNVIELPRTRQRA